MLCIESEQHNWSLQDQSPEFKLYSKKNSFASICVKDICIGRSNARGVVLLRLLGKKKKKTAVVVACLGCIPKLCNMVLNVSSPITKIISILTLAHSSCH